MKRTLFVPIIILSICTSSCIEKSTNKKDNKRTGLISAPYNIISGSDGTRFNYDSLSTNIINYGIEGLKHFNYKFPQKELFQKRIEEVYGIDITKYQNKVVVLRASDFPEIIIKKERYILVQDSDAANEFYINQEVLYLYNKYIINNDKQALNLLKTKDPYLLKDLVTHYGYNRDKDLMKFVLKDFTFDNTTDFHHLIFSNLDHQFVLRNSILDDIESISYKGKTQDLLSEAKDGSGYDSLDDILDMIVKTPSKYDNSDEYITFLGEKSLNVGGMGTVQSFLHKHPSIKDQLAKQNYYNFERLRMFSENLNVADNTSETFTIKDPDGYTNLWKEKNAQSEILQKVKSGQNV